MYIAYRLSNGRKREVGRYDSVTDFNNDSEFKNCRYYVIGYVIYVIA